MRARSIEAWQHTTFPLRESAFLNAFPSAIAWWSQPPEILHVVREAEPIAEQPRIPYVLRDDEDLEDHSSLSNPLRAVQP